MSTNQQQIQLLSGQHSGLRYAAYEINNSVDIKPAATLYAHTYSHIKISHEFDTTRKCNKCDVLITNRFTMDFKRFTIDSWSQYTDMTKIDDTDVSYYSAYTDLSTRTVQLALSMQDFMFGDVLVQFYDTDIDEFCPPIIVQFTNAPTIFVSDIYKMNATDKDSIFFSSAGATVPDSGRTDVLPNENYYAEVLQNDRLITNGKLASDDASVDYHPTYVITYSSFVPSAFSYQFGKRNVVGFTFADTSAYLTSAVTVTSNDLAKMLNPDEHVTMKCKVEDDTQDYELNVSESFKVKGHCTKFNTYLVSPNETITDEWFRKRNRVCTDFKLSGLDPYWTTDA